MNSSTTAVYSAKSPKPSRCCRKTNKLLAYLSDKAGHWHQDDILNIVTTLNTGPLPLAQKTAPFGINSKQPVVLQNSLFSTQNIVLVFV